jgi:MFS family permease
VIGRRGPLADRNFRLLLAARSISYFGTYLAPIAVAFAVLDLTGSATDTGIAFACWTVAQVGTLLVGGIVADRLPRRLVMVGSDTANVVVRSAMGTLLLSGHARIWELFVLQAVGGAATAFYSPASTGLVPEIVRSESLQQANAYMGIARYLAFPIGAAVGGAIVATIGSGTALLVDAGTYAASAVLLIGIRLPSRAATAKAQNFVRELREGFGLRVQPRHPWRVVCPVFALSAVQSVLLAAHAEVAAIAAAAVVAGFSFSYGSVLFETGVQRAIARHLLGRVSAYNWMAAMTFLPLGYATAGWIGDLVGMSAYLVVGAAWIVLATGASMLVPNVRDFRLGAPEHPNVPAQAMAT